MESKPLVVVGAGVAGTAAAIEAARAGVRVTLVDENPIGASMMALDVPQFFGQRAMDPLPARDVLLERAVSANHALAEAEEAGVEVQLGTCVWGAFGNSATSRVLDGPQLGLADHERSWMIKHDRLIVAAGARDLALSFPGSGLAGVMGANGAHALMSRYRALTSRRMVVLGSGDLGLNTARMAQEHDVEVAAVVDVSASVRGDEALMARLRGTGVELYTSHTVKKAVGGADEIESVVLVGIDENCKPVAGTEKVVSADIVCLAIGLVPNVELLGLLGCDLSFTSERGGWAPVHDDRMRTSVDSVFVAGDVAGCHDGMVVDTEIAQAQGRLAGLAAAESLGAIDKDDALAQRNDLRPAALDATPADAQSGWQRWHRSLVNTGGLEVFVCQCEEVTRAEIIGLQAPRYLGRGSEKSSRRGLRTQVRANPVNADQVKRLTRAGMGHCQGRLCREQVSLLLAEESGADIADIPYMSYRPPVRPLPLRVMWPHDEPEQVRSEWPKWFSPTSRVLG
ncbi:MAG: NAD(P)/FAD-dependent oxidoreductase [Chloroflexi bacterium]|nr:NAD(P)/FAD-dependent oxidoreductase [Chloroflexota bacterium]